MISTKLRCSLLYQRNVSTGTLEVVNTILELFTFQNPFNFPNFHESKGVNDAGCSLLSTGS
jgi:hypothetical protein